MGSRTIKRLVEDHVMPLAIILLATTAGRGHWLGCAEMLAQR